MLCPLRKRCRASLATALQKLAHLTIFLSLAASPALAHDRHGNAAMNQDVRVLIEKDHVEVIFAIDTNDEARIVEAIAMDANGDGKLSPEEQSAYFAQLDGRLREGLQITLGGNGMYKDVVLAPSGQVDLSPPFRKTFHFRGVFDPLFRFPHSLAVHNDNFLDWPGRAAMDVKLGEGFHEWSSVETTPTDACAHLTHGGKHRVRLAVDWSEWAWSRMLLTPMIIFGTALVLLIVACQFLLFAKSPPVRMGVGGTLVMASLGLAIVAFLPRAEPSTPDLGWQDDFHDFHVELSAALAAYHQNGNRASLASHCAPDAMKKLTAATRVVAANDEKSGAFELRRVRPITTTILSEPHRGLFPTLRVHHEWRAIGLMRHEGHPHERVRDFACDYTLRVTDRGLQLIDCSNWHQLPDEPLE
jgi:hypothetical protein